MVGIALCSQVLFGISSRPRCIMQWISGKDRDKNSDHCKVFMEEVHGSNLVADWVLQILVLEGMLLWIVLVLCRVAALKTVIWDRRDSVEDRMGLDLLSATRFE